MKKALVPLRRELEAAVAKAVADGRKLRKGEVVGPFLDRGASRSTLYKWLEDYLATGKPAAAVAERAKAAAQARAERAKAAAQARARIRRAERAELPKGPDPVAEVVEALPVPVPRLEHMVAMRSDDVMAELRTCADLARKVIDQSLTEDGKVRLTKTALAASEHLRRTMATIIAAHEAIASVARVDGFVAELLELLNQVAVDYPPAAELIVRRVRTMGARWRS